MILRQTRGLIDKSLLESARNQISGCMAGTRPDQADESSSRFEKIDREKNLATIMKFIEMKADNKLFMKQMQVILQECQT